MPSCVYGDGDCPKIEDIKEDIKDYKIEVDDRVSKFETRINLIYILLGIVIFELTGSIIG